MEMTEETRKKFVALIKEKVEEIDDLRTTYYPQFVIMAYPMYLDLLCNNLEILDGELQGIIDALKKNIDEGGAVPILFVHDLPDILQGLAVAEKGKKCIDKAK